MYALAARSPGLLVLILGFAALFEGGWYTAAGLVAMPLGIAMLRLQLRGDV